MSDKISEFEIWCDDTMVASTSGERFEALKEAGHYAYQYAEDGKIKIYEVFRKEIKFVGIENE